MGENNAIKSILTCPRCGFQSAEQMPTDACQFFYVCKGCGQKFKPLAGDLLRVLFVRVGALPAGAAKREKPVLPVMTGQDTSFGV